MPWRMNSSPTVLIDSRHEADVAAAQRGADSVARFFMMRGSLFAQGEWRNSPARPCRACRNGPARRRRVCRGTTYDCPPINSSQPVGEEASPALRRRRKPGRTRRGFQINADAKGSENGLPISQPQGLDSALIQLVTKTTRSNGSKIVTPAFIGTTSFVAHS